MTTQTGPGQTADAELLHAVGLPAAALQAWHRARPEFTVEKAAQLDLGRDAERLASFCLAGEGLLSRLPPRPRRDQREQAAAEAIHAALRSARLSFLRLSAVRVYEELTDARRRYVRVEELVYAAAERFPGLAPTRQQVLADREQAQKDKEGHEIDQGLFLSQMLSHPRAGQHLVHAMLRPRPESLDRLPHFQRTGRAQLGDTLVERRDGVGHLYHANPRFLNAEDDTTTATVEVATDVILLDPRIEVGVLRGQPVEHPKHAGRRIFNAGINLTHLYHGKIGFVDFFIVREMGYLHKMYRGLSSAAFWPNDVEDTQEKPWIAAVEAFAIGGGCQLLLAMDYVLAERSAFFNLPARKEGIIPGAANMRLWRFVGDRAARQAILFDRQFPADSRAGRLICDEVVPDGEMDAALARTVTALTTSGVVSAAGNRKAMRIGQEPIELFRQDMAMYCREQVACHYSAQLIRNLEQDWQAHQRSP